MPHTQRTLARSDSTLPQMLVMNGGVERAPEWCTVCINKGSTTKAETNLYTNREEKWRRRTILLHIRANKNRFLQSLGSIFATIFAWIKMPLQMTWRILHIHLQHSQFASRTHTMQTWTKGKSEWTNDKKKHRERESERRKKEWLRISFRCSNYAWARIISYFFLLIICHSMRFYRRCEHEASLTQFSVVVAFKYFILAKVTWLDADTQHTLSSAAHGSRRGNWFFARK